MTYGRLHLVFGRASIPCQDFFDLGRRIMMDRQLGLRSSQARPPADDQQAELDALRAIFMQFPMIPALKATVARFSGDATWGAVRPPLMDLTEDAAASLASRLDEAGFEMPGLGD